MDITKMWLGFVSLIVNNNFNQRFTKKICNKRNEVYN